MQEIGTALGLGKLRCLVIEIDVRPFQVTLGNDPQTARAVSRPAPAFRARVRMFLVEAAAQRYQILRMVEGGQFKLSQQVRLTTAVTETADLALERNRHIAVATWNLHSQGTILGRFY